MKYLVSGIEWDCDGKSPEEYNLPTDAQIESDNEELVVDELSDKYGFCIKSVSEITEIKLVYLVHGYYDMGIISSQSEIIIEPYATEELAKARVRVLIDTFKKGNGYEGMENGESDAGCWNESEYILYAYEDSEWNVDIGYNVEEVRQSLPEDW